jgi:hypothetical protein
MIRDARGAYHTIGAPHEGNGDNGHGAHTNGHDEPVLEPVGASAGAGPGEVDDDPPGTGADGGSALPGDDGHPGEA